MSRLWYRVNGKWAWEPLDHDLISLCADAPYAVTSSASMMAAQLTRLIEGDTERWGLIVRRGQIVRVNGNRVNLGIAALCDRDSIQIKCGGRMFFSTESTPVVAPYPDRPVVQCGRCQTKVLPGEPTVKCPRCGMFFHQTEDLPCWLLGSCPCGQPAALNDDNCWRPEEV